MTASMTSVIARPRAGLQEEIDRIEREDGNEPEGSLRLRHTAEIRTCAEVHEVLRRVRSVDAQLPAGRRAPRTVQEMRARLSQHATAATEDDLNRDLDNPAEDWDQAVPRTVLPEATGDNYSECRVKNTVAAELACSECGGAGGKTVDTSGGGVTRQTWHSCNACKGSGVAR